LIHSDRKIEADSISFDRQVRAR